MTSNKTTLVTGIWDLGRGSIDDGGMGEGVWKRSFDHYVSKFKDLLRATKDTNLIIFIDPSLNDTVWSIRNKENTAVYFHKKDDFGGNFFPFFDKVQEIRKNNRWLSQNGWIKDSTQAQMPFYNPMVMSKMFLLHNAKIFNPFNSEYMFWIDGGLTNTVHPGYFSHDKVINKIEELVNKFLFVCFPYESSTDIHGFYINDMEKFAKHSPVDRVARGGFFGGHIDYIAKANEIYYSLLDSTLKEGCMGTEESIFTLMTYLDSDFEYESIKNDGLISTFFENVKNGNTKLKNKKNLIKNYSKDIIQLYINTFNCPKQLQLLIDSFEQNDINFLDKTEKILINNSNSSIHDEEYNNIIQKYGFKEVKEGNLGVCGARQRAAEMFKDSETKYMMFFEDDMLLDLSNTFCSFGFRKKINNFYYFITKLMDKENYDFIKFSFSEFYGHNGEQWSWHNVPEPRKTEFFGKRHSRPFTQFKNIKSLEGCPYADGEIYYSNWPHIIGQEGNQKLFLDTTWAHPFEQTWMSHIYSLTRQGKANPAILLASPITHNRVYFYEGNERKES